MKFCRRKFQNRDYLAVAPAQLVGDELRKKNWEAPECKCGKWSVSSLPPLCEPRRAVLELSHFGS